MKRSEENTALCDALHLCAPHAAETAHLTLLNDVTMTVSTYWLWLTKSSALYSGRTKEWHVELFCLPSLYIILTFPEAVTFSFWLYLKKP
jgi:hypothetical protein